MLNRLPRQLPALSAMLQDIGNPPIAKVARALRVSERTVQRWIAADQAPHAVELALYWITKWGMQAVDAEIFNRSTLHLAYARATEETNRALVAELDRVLSLGDTGAANAPSWRTLPLLHMVPINPSRVLERPSRPR